MKKVVKKVSAPTFSRNELIRVANAINTIVKPEDKIVTSKYKEIVPLMEIIWSTCKDIDLGRIKEAPDKKKKKALAAYELQYAKDYHLFEARDRAVLNQISNHYSEVALFPKSAGIPPVPPLEEPEIEEEEEDEVPIKMVQFETEGDESEDEAEEEEEDEDEPDAETEDEDEDDDGKPVHSLKGKTVTKPAAKVATKVVAAQAKKAESNNIAKALELLQKAIDLLVENDVPVKVITSPKQAAKPAPKAFVKAAKKVPAKPVKKTVKKETKEQGIKDVVVDYIVQNGSLKSGVSNDDILDALCEMFDNDRAKMAKTISGIPPKIRSGAISHYVDSEGEEVEIDFTIEKNKKNLWYTK